jgi:cell division protein FtsB
VLQVNLLPPEYRPRTGTPVARFAAIVGSVVLVACAFGVYAYTHFIELAKVRDLRSAREEEAKAKEVQRDRSVALQRELDNYEKRRTAIQTINRSRILLSRKLDQFFDIVTGQDGEAGIKAWLADLEIPAQATVSRRKAKPVKKGEEAEGGPFRFTGYLAMASSHEAPAQGAAFYRSLTGDPDATGRRTDFYGDFVRISNPNVQIEDMSRDKDLVFDPPVVGSFQYELVFRAPAAPGPVKAPPARSRR